MLTTDGPLLIIAGPGSGKTRVIVHRIAHLILDRGVAPWSILAVTFTNKAAREMRERVEQLLGRDSEGLAVGTFHSQCSRILRREGQAIGVDPHFNIFDDGDQIDVIRRALRELDLDEKRFSPRSFLSAISAAKSELIDVDQFRKRAEGFWQETVASVFVRYQDALLANHALDFDDLIGETIRLFQETPEVLTKYQDRYPYQMVDEFQDTNLAQYRLVRLLGQKHRNVCVVGDEDQSVYSWRKADIRNLLYFERDFPELKTTLLEQNYRSTQTILDVARAVIAPNKQRKEKKLWTENERGRPVVVHEAYNEGDEAQFVLREIERLSRSDGLRYADMAVMYRVNAQSRAIEDAFVRRGVPYKLIGGTRFYERKEVKDVLAYLRLAQNPSDTISLARVINTPTRGIGDKTVNEVQRWSERSGLSLAEALEAIAESRDEDTGSAVVQTRARSAIRGFVNLLHALQRGREEMTTAELLDFMLESSGYANHVRDGSEEGEERWANIMELRTKANEFAELAPPLGLAAMLEEVALVQDVDGFNAESNGVTLITLHAAKGLEFPFVFMVGLEEGLCPHSRSLDDPAQMEEERRLVYVGITRAMQGLYLVHAAHRMLYGSVAQNAPSRFLIDIPLELMTGGRPAPHVMGNGRPAVAPAGWTTTPRIERNGADSIRAFTPSISVSPLPLGHHPGRRLAGPRGSGGAPQLQRTGEGANGHTKGAGEDSSGEQQYFPGDRVFHPSFGTGVVVSSLMHRGDEEVTIAFEGKGVKKLMAAYAPLQRS